MEQENGFRFGRVSPFAEQVETAVFRKRYSKIIAQTVEKSSMIP